MRKLKVPGAQNGSADVYTKSGTRTRESKFRDVYTPRDVKRSNAKEITSFTPAKIATGLMSVALFFILWAGAGGVVWLYNSFVTFVHPELPNVAYMASVKYAVGHFPWNVIVVALWVVLTLTLYLYMKDSWRMENISTDNSDINDYDNDAALQTPTELPYNYDIAPDAFAHYDGDVTAILSHMHFTNKGLHKWPGGSQIFDGKFSDKLYASDGVPEDKALRVRYDATQIAYNPGGKIHGKADFESVADVINKTWTLPKYEGGRPGGAYIADTSPSNTMVIASTRAGKGNNTIHVI